MGANYWRVFGVLAWAMAAFADLRDRDVIGGLLMIAGVIALAGADVIRAIEKREP